MAVKPRFVDKAHYITADEYAGMNDLRFLEHENASQFDAIPPAVVTAADEDEIFRILELKAEEEAAAVI